MKSTTLVLLAAAGLALLSPVAVHAQAAPLATRTFQLYTAPLGPSIDSIMNQLKPLIVEAGRQITEVKIIQQINIGKITGVQVTHTSTRVASFPKWHSQDVYVAPLFGNAFQQAWQVVNFQKMANKPLIDVEIIQQINIGKVTGLRLYFGDSN